MLLIDRIILSFIEKTFDRRDEKKTCFDTSVCTLSDNNNNNNNNIHSDLYSLVVWATLTMRVVSLLLYSCLILLQSNLVFSKWRFTDEHEESDRLHFVVLSILLLLFLGLHEYIGCFIDQQADRDLERLIGDYSDLTPDQCLLLCQNQQYPIAALQSGNQCHCGRTHGKYGQAPDYECSYLCSSGEKCGGFLRNSIYRSTESIDLSQGRTGRWLFSCFSFIQTWSRKRNSFAYWLTRINLSECCHRLSRLFQWWCIDC